MTTEPTRAALLEAPAELGREHPSYRLGQTLSNLAMAARRLDAGGVWDLEDDEALAAARSLLKARSSGVGRVGLTSTRPGELAKSGRSTMRRTIIRSSALAMVLGVTTPLAITDLPRSRNPAEATTQEPGARLDLTFDPSDLDAEAERLHRSIRDTIDGSSTIPDDRKRYFSTVNNVNGYTVNSWGATITDVQPIADGYLVSIEILPRLSADWAACAIIVDSDYSERFHVSADGTLRYVDSLYPRGQGGQIFTIVGL